MASRFNGGSFEIELYVHFVIDSPFPKMRPMLNPGKSIRSFEGKNFMRCYLPGLQFIVSGGSLSMGCPVTSQCLSDGTVGKQRQKRPFCETGRFHDRVIHVPAENIFFADT